MSCLAEWAGVCVCVWWTDCLSGRAAGCRVWRSGPVSVSVCVVDWTDCLAGRQGGPCLAEWAGVVSVSVCGGLTVCLAGRQGVVSGGVGRCLCLCVVD